MWELIPLKKLPPTRMVRYCCDILKETGCRNRMIATGVRKNESHQRESRETYEIISRRKKDKIALSDELMLMNDNGKKREFLEHCQTKRKSVVNPIIDWKDTDIWEYIEQNKLDVNPLYKMGYYRVGCVGCPMAGKIRYKEFADFPQYKSSYIRAFDKMLEAIWKTGAKTRWKTGEEVFRWWMEDKNIDGQITLDEFM